MAETDGLTAYGLITCDAVWEMGLTEYFDANARRTETYEHIGEIEYFVRPLREAWLNRRDKRRILVGGDDDLLVPEQSLTAPISPQAAFTLVTRPDLRRLWLHADKIDLPDGPKGRIAEDTVFHCQHGDQTVIYEIVDWRPGEYVTGKIRLPLDGSILETREFSPVGDGVLIKTRFSRVTGGGFLSRLITPVIETKARQIIPKMMEEGTPALQRMAEEMRGAGPTRAPDAPTDLAAIGVTEAIAGRFAS